MQQQKSASQSLHNIVTLLNNLFQNQILVAHLSQDKYLLAFHTSSFVVEPFHAIQIAPVSYNGSHFPSEPSQITLSLD
jgi:hypothetical protein